MEKADSRDENKTRRTSNIFKTKALSGIHILLVMSMASIMVICISLAPSINTVQAQTANQSSLSSSKASSPPSPTTAAKQQVVNNQPTTALANITGSIPLRPTISAAIYSKVKTTLTDAVTIAQRAIGSNTSATLAFLRPLNGYLVYDVHVRNNANNTLSAVIVDAGNGKVLYKQTPPSLVFGAENYGIMSGQGKIGPSVGREVG